MAFHHSAHLANSDDGSDQLWGSVVGVGLIDGLASARIFRNHLGGGKNLSNRDFNAWNQTFLQDHVEMA